MAENQLTVQDHTHVVGYVMDNVFRIIAELDVLGRIANKKRPTRYEILDTIVSMKTIDPTVRDKLMTAMKALPEFWKRLEALPKADRDDLDEAVELLVGSRSMEDLRRNLDRVERRHAGKPGAEGAKLARSLLDDGKNSIYDLSHPFYRLGVNSKAPPFVVFSAKGVVKTDLAATVGAGMTGIGAQGALAVGAGASATQSILDILNAIWPDDEVNLFEDIGDIVPGIP